jgi:hypothetical protein
MLVQLIAITKKIIIIIIIIIINYKIIPTRHQNGLLLGWSIIEISLGGGAGNTRKGDVKCREVLVGKPKSMWHIWRSELRG